MLKRFRRIYQNNYSDVRYNSERIISGLTVQHEQHVYFLGYDSDGERAAPSSALITRGLVNT